MSSNTTIISVSTPSSSLIIILNIILNSYLAHLPLIFIIFGVIGFIGNAFTFLQPDLRANTFCIYSLCSSFVDVSNLLLNRLPRYLYQAYGHKMAWDTDSSVCKFEIFALVYLPQLAINLLVLSLIDRYACTCSLTSPIRRLNKPKLTIWFISITIIYSVIAVFHGPVFNGVVPNRGCVATPPITNSILYFIFCGLIQPIAMLIFVFLTYRNIVKSRQRVTVAPTRNTFNPRNQFIRLVFIQVFVTSFITIQWIIVYAYYMMTLNDVKTPEQQTIGTFAFLTGNYIQIFNSVKSFYLSTLTCRLFRHTFLKGIHKIFPNQINGGLATTQTNLPTNHTERKTKRIDEHEV